MGGGGESSRWHRPNGDFEPKKQKRTCAHPAKLYPYTFSFEALFSDRTVSGPIVGLHFLHDKGNKSPLLLSFIHFLRISECHHIFRISNDFLDSRGCPNLLLKFKRALRIFFLSKSNAIMESSLALRRSFMANKSGRNHCQRKLKGGR